MPELVRKTIFDKTLSEYTLDEKLRAADCLFQYLKQDGVSDPLSPDKRRLTLTTGHVLQHVEWFEKCKDSQGNPMGYEDDLVFYCDLIVPGQPPQKTLLGTGFSSDANQKLGLLNLLSDDDLKGVQFAINTHNALASMRKKRK